MSDLKIVPRLFYLLVRAELPSLLNRRLQDIAILMYKIKYGKATNRT